MALKDQIHIYSVDTSAFATEYEKQLYDAMNYYRRKISVVELICESNGNIQSKLRQSRLSEIEIEDIRNKLYYNMPNDVKKEYRARISEIKNELKGSMMLTNLNNVVRELDESHLRESNIIAVFDSTLARTLKMKPRLEVYTDVIIVQVYYFEVLQDLVMNGFMLNGEKYSYYGSSSGQIKTKKAVFIKESKWMKYDEKGKEIWSKEGKSLMCGLTFKDINDKGGEKGINPNKFNAYLSLNNSATDVFTSFSIDNVIVVDDWESNVFDVVDFINTDTFKISRNKKMNVPINQMDGCGIMLPDSHSKAFMVRAPFIKGLLVPFDFLSFIEENNASTKVKDIYGKEWDLVSDGIKCIMTKSQFKLSKYYDNWDDYKIKFKKNKCEIAYANEEEDRIKNSKINYQMLQTLSEMTDDEIEYVTKKSRDTIHKITSNKDTIFRILGITDFNNNKNYLQKSIEAYPPLISDSYTKKVIKQVKDKVVKDAKSGKVEISGKYVFMIPDLYAFCEHLFLQDENPKGLLSRGEISCNIYKEHSKLACLRAPHLYREWGIRTNVNNELTKKWFLSNGLYMSSNDLLSKLVMNDWDSDKSLIISDEKIIDIAERHMDGINPLYYEMAIATSGELSMATRYKGLIDAYKGGGIGMYSNHISKIWNSADGEIELDLIRYLVMVNNFQIDFSKTLFKIPIPKEINKKISSKTKMNVPYFFKYAKDKTDDQVEPINQSTMNKICKSIPNPRISFKNSQFGEFDYRMLMSRWDFEAKDIDNAIIDVYFENIKEIPFSISEKSLKNGVTPYVFTKIRDIFNNGDSDIIKVVDNIIYYSFNHKKTENKLTLWTSFGDIVYNNLINNLKYKKPCERCGLLIDKTSNRIKYCDNCRKGIQLEHQIKSMKKLRNVK